MQVLRQRFIDALDLGLLRQPLDEVSHAAVVFFPRRHRVITGRQPFAEPSSQQFQFPFPALVHGLKKISALLFFANASRSRLKRLNDKELIVIFPLTRPPQGGHKLPSRSPFSATRFIFSPQGLWRAARSFLLAARIASAAIPRHPPGRAISAGRLRPGDRRPVRRRSACRWRRSPSRGIQAPRAAGSRPAPANHSIPWPRGSRAWSIALLKPRSAAPSPATRIAGGTPRTSRARAAPARPTRARAPPSSVRLPARCRRA